MNKLFVTLILLVGLLAPSKSGAANIENEVSVFENTTGVFENSPEYLTPEGAKRAMVISRSDAKTPKIFSNNTPIEFFITGRKARVIISVLDGDCRQVAEAGADKYVADLVKQLTDYSSGEMEKRVKQKDSGFASGMTQMVNMIAYGQTQPDFSQFFVVGSRKTEPFMGDVSASVKIDRIVLTDIPIMQYWKVGTEYEFTSRVYYDAAHGKTVAAIFFRLLIFENKNPKPVAAEQEEMLVGLCRLLMNAMKLDSTYGSIHEYYADMCRKYSPIDMKGDFEQNFKLKKSPAKPGDNNDTDDNEKTKKEKEDVLIGSKVEKEDGAVGQQGKDVIDLPWILRIPEETPQDTTTETEQTAAIGRCVRLKYSTPRAIAENDTAVYLTHLSADMRDLITSINKETGAVHRLYVSSDSYDGAISDIVCDRGGRLYALRSTTTDGRTGHHIYDMFDQKVVGALSSKSYRFAYCPEKEIFAMYGEKDVIYFDKEFKETARYTLPEGSGRSPKFVFDAQGVGYCCGDYSKSVKVINNGTERELALPKMGVLGLNRLADGSAAVTLLRTGVFVLSPTAVAASPLTALTPSQIVFGLDGHTYGLASYKGLYDFGMAISDEGKLIETPLHSPAEDAHRYRNSHKEIALIHVDSLGNLWLISQMKNHVFVFNTSGDIAGYGTMEGVVENK